MKQDRAFPHLFHAHHPCQASRGSSEVRDHKNPRRTESMAACSSTWGTMNPRGFLGSRLPQQQGHGGARSFSSAIRPLLPPPHPVPEEVHGISFWPWVDGRTQAKLQGWTWNGTDASASVFPGGVGAAPGAFHVLFPGDKRGRERSYEGLLSVC